MQLFLFLHIWSWSWTFSCCVQKLEAPGELTNRRSAQVAQQPLGIKFEKVGLAKCFKNFGEIHVEKKEGEEGEKEQGEEDKPKWYSDVIEALISAVYIDSGCDLMKMGDKSQKTKKTQSVKRLK